MVQHLIEKCLLFRMNQEECVEALSKHANIKPVITTTVWKELEKENREFFETYSLDLEREHGRSKAEDAEARRIIRQTVKDSDS
ncbi:unnamed protein product [Victoria cruziana]